MPQPRSDDASSVRPPAMSRLVGALIRIVDLGVDEHAPPSVSRWHRTVNVVAVASMCLSTVFAFVWLRVDFSALWPVAATDIVWSAGYVVVLALSARGRPRAAAWLLLVIGLGNTVVPGAKLGATTGVFLFIVLVPMLGVLVTGPTDTAMRVAVTVVGVAAFVLVPLLFPDAPAYIAGTPTEQRILMISAVSVGLFGAGFALYYRWLVDSAENALAEANARSERLLLNILPEPIAERLKSDESPIADRIDSVTVLFADITDSTALSERLTADDYVALLDRLFSDFDEITERFGLEKVATIGDGYFAVSGLPIARSDHIEAAARAALVMRDRMSVHSVPGFGPVRMRFGLSAGPVVAGVIGRRKFRYDLWGDTVNTASRMQAHGEPGMIHVTDRVRDELCDRYDFEPRGCIDVKGKGPMNTYFLLGPRSTDGLARARAARPGRSGTPVG